MSTLSTGRRPASLPPAPPPSGAAISEPALLAMVAAGAVAVLALWWHDTVALSGPGDWLMAVGRVTGLLAGWAIAVVMLLMARVPAIERGLGADRLARWHSMGGRYVVSLATVHALAIVWGYSVSFHKGLVGEGVDVVVNYPEVLKGTIGTLALVGVGVLSARAARARVSYETWYHVHLVTYLAVFLTFGHVLANGADFHSGLSKLVWKALYVAVFAALLWFRWLTPLVYALRHRLRVQAVVPEGPGVVSVVVRGEDLHRLRAQPGQFFRWRFLAPGLWWQSHPYSLSAAPTPTHLRITVKELGDGSGELARLRPGTRVIAEGPYGAFTPGRRRGHGVLLLAGGIGITPLRAMLEHLGPHVGPITLVYRAERRDDVILAAEIDALAASRRARVHYLVGPVGSTEDALVGRRLRKLVPDLPARDVFVCGPPRFMDAAEEALARSGARRRHVHLEQFSF
ncbi:MAG TPA: ferredoxin reductase family protein [Motilibacteraceae bacterium]|nr:ferredoxin reductase family protein [Motilibacteraceae bacterium]